MTPGRLELWGIISPLPANGSMGDSWPKGLLSLPDRLLLAGGGGQRPKTIIERVNTPRLTRRFSTYTEANWLDHLQIIYTLPYIGRLDEAKAKVPDLLKLRPDMTVREADRFYKMFCFDEDYRQRMDSALRLAGLPEQ